MVVSHLSLANDLWIRPSISRWDEQSWKPPLYWLPFDHCHPSGPRSYLPPSLTDSVAAVAREFTLGHGIPTLFGCVR